MVLTSPLGTSVTVTPVSGVSTVELSTEFDGQDPYGIWTLAITDFVKGNTHMLNQWSLTLNDPAQAAPAADLAISAWLPSDSSDDDTDPLATQAADELALMLVE
jgi:subtilisin-like proprotein convertase family protein